jgi:hypothetical protein
MVWWAGGAPLFGFVVSFVLFRRTRLLMDT